PRRPSRPSIPGWCARGSLHAAPCDTIGRRESRRRCPETDNQRGRHGRILFSKVADNRLPLPSSIQKCGEDQCDAEGSSSRSSLQSLPLPELVPRQPILSRISTRGKPCV